jgi:pimeloyl-ACP methyl ester carboxylesterase
MISRVNRTASRAVHEGLDAIMCAMMNLSQWRLRSHAVTRDRLEEYLAECRNLGPRDYYAVPEEGSTAWRHDGNQLSWNSPLATPYPENNTARSLLFDTGEPAGAPTIILLHALMSANDFGYRRIAARFNRRGWNVLFPHLPHHYTRKPRGHANGSLAITSDLVRNAKTLRQAVIELRQLIDWARRRGSRRIALLGTSYGAWVSAITLSQEEIDFAILLQPVADVGHATFGSPASRTMASLLGKNGIHRSDIDRHAHLSSPLHTVSATSPDRITIIGGKHDRLSPPESLKKLCAAWGGARYLEVDQGHFGYGAMRCALAEADRYL